MIDFSAFMFYYVENIEKKGGIAHMVFDLIIKNGNVLDGTGTKAFSGDIAIKGGQIAKVADCIEEETPTIIDATGKTVCPGFIDPHAHNDGYIFLDPSNIYKLAQGVTTEISGNCGEGLAPVTATHYDEIFEYYRPYYPTEALCTYTSEKNYFSDVKKLPLGNNIGFLCAHGTLRMAVMGFAARKPSDEEMNRMKTLLAECMEAGALGMSSGLVYSPGCFADTEELAELCKVVKEYGGIYTTHIRSEGYQLAESIKEAIEISRRTGIRTVISHMKALGRNYWGMTEETTRLVEEARTQGLAVYCDQYPYTTSCTVLHWVIPIEYTEGGFTQMCKNLSDPTQRQAIKDMYQNKHGQWDNLMENITPAGIHILKADKTPDAVGKTLLEYAQSIGNDPYDVLFDIIVENKADAIAAYDCMSEEDICRIMKKDYCMVGSDGIAVKPEEKTHPRLTGTFPRVLEKYVRKEKVIPLELAIKKMTSLPAKVMGLKKKGTLQEGFDADICIFDPDTIREKGTLMNFNAKPEGIEYVLVGGKIACKNGIYTNAASGNMILRK